MEGWLVNSGRGLIEALSRHLPRGTAGKKKRKPAVMIAGDTGEIRNQHLPNINLERHHQTNCLARLVLIIINRTNNFNHTVFKCFNINFVNWAFIKRKSVYFTMASRLWRTLQCVQVTLAMRLGLTGHVWLPIQVDKTVTSLLVTIQGPVNTVLLQDNSGKHFVPQKLRVMSTNMEFLYAKVVGQVKHFTPSPNLHLLTY
jgi:hypothetical protein